MPDKTGIWHPVSDPPKATEEDVFGRCSRPVIVRETDGKIRPGWKASFFPDFHNGKGVWLWNGTPYCVDVAEWLEEERCIVSQYAIQN